MKAVRDSPPRVPWMALAVGQNEAPCPANMCLLGAQVAMAKPQPATELIQQLRGRGCRYALVVRGATHTPDQTPDHTAGIDTRARRNYPASH